MASPRSSTRAASRAATRHNPMADTRRNTVANRGRPRRSAGASASSSHGTRTSTVAVADTPRSVADMSLSDLLDAVGQRVQAEMGSRATAVQQGGRPQPQFPLPASRKLRECKLLLHRLCPAGRQVRP